MRVLVIEDEAPLREQLTERLRAEGFAVDAAPDGPEGLWFGREHPIDLAVVDLGLPGLPGLDVIRGWRESGRAFPILILTARGRWQDKVDGLEAGADDYLVKPFHVEELLARVRSLLRRAAGWSRSSIRCGPLALDLRAREVRLEGEPVALTAYEYRLLEYLVMHAGEVIGKTELAEHVYEEALERESNVVEVLLGRVRRKIDPERRLQPIETLRGRGYRLRLARDDG